MIASTIAHACGKIPSLNHGEDFIIWEANFRTLKFPL
jgi:hypothetical protein